AALGFIARRRARKVLESAVGVIGANRRAMDLLHEQAPAGIAASIPATGVALPPLRTPGAGPLVAGFAGRLVPERGADLFFSALSQTYGKWDAVVAGTGPEQERLEAQVQQLGLAARIRWLGGIRQETLEAFWPAIDCLVVPSRDTPGWIDQSPPFLIEAMGRGIVPIVTKAGALPEIVGPAGIVAADAAGLTEALQPFAADPASCRARSSATRQWVLDRYVTSVVAARTVEFWQAAREHAAPALAHTH
ncbi:MAG: glycosyltransferase family 4 protein, partial [Gemmatimonadales bacterium]